MDRKNLKRLQSISHRVNRDRTEIAQEFVNTLKSKLAERKYRADLSMVTASKNTSGTFHAEVKYNAQLGYPAEQDLLTLVAQNYPTHQIDWELLNADPNAGIIMLTLEPSVEVVPVGSIKEIPPEFTAIGTGLYKRAADNSGKINELWTLKKNDNGLALYRNQDDLEITADDDEGFKAGDVISCPLGVGKIKSFDDFGNAFVQLGNRIRLISASDMKPYEIDKERGKLKDYYTEIYGPEYAEKLTKKLKNVERK